MSARNGPSVVAAPSTSVTAKSRPVAASTSSTTASTSTSSKFVKNTVSGGQQPKQLTSPTLTGVTSSFFHPTTSSKTHAEAATAKESSSSKLARRESVKSKASENGNRKSIFGWIRHHMGDDGAKSSGAVAASGSSSSSSRGTKKKLETAASFARAHAAHLSGSMPSLVLQHTASGSDSSTTSSSSVTSTHSTNTGSSGTGDVIKYRMKKTPVTATTSDEGSGGGAARSKSSIPVRNRWSSYDITGAAGLGLPLVTVEDSDESAAGDDDERRSTTSTTAPHHLLGARSVESLYVSGAAAQNKPATNANQQHAFSDAGLSTNAPTITTTSGSVAAASRHGRSTEDDLIENLRVIDERIVKARGDRNHLIAQLLDVPHRSFDKVSEDQSSKSSNHRELLLTSLNEVDRLTSCISDILRMTESTNGTKPGVTTREDPTATPTHSNNDAVDRRFHGNEKKTDHRNCFSADHSSVRVFLEIGVRLQQQLSQLKQSMVCSQVATKGDTDAPPSGEQMETVQQIFGEQLILASNCHIDPPDLEQPVSDRPSEDVGLEQPLSNNVMTSPSHQTDVIPEERPEQGSELSSGCPGETIVKEQRESLGGSETIVLEQPVSSNETSPGGPSETTFVEQAAPSSNGISPAGTNEAIFEEEQVSGSELSLVSSGCQSVSPGGSETIVLEQRVNSLEAISVEHPVPSNELSSGCLGETLVTDLGPKQPLSNDELSGDITVTEQSVTSSGWPIEIAIDPAQLHSSDVIIELSGVGTSGC